MPKISDARLREMLECDVLPRLGAGRVAAWDLDSTVWSTVKRRHMVPLIKAGGPDAPTWDHYSMACSGDEPLHGSVVLMRELASLGYVNIAISGRNMCSLGLTWEMTRKYQIPLAAIVLRQDGDHAPNAAWKVRVLRALSQWYGADIRMFFEDWREAAEEIQRETGIPVVGINPFYPDEHEGGT